MRGSRRLGYRFWQTLGVNLCGPVVLAYLVDLPREVVRASNLLVPCHVLVVLLGLIHFANSIPLLRHEVKNTAHVEAPGIREELNTPTLILDVEHSNQDIGVVWIVVEASHLFRL